MNAALNATRWLGTAALLALLTIGAAAQNADEVIEKSFQVGEGGLLSVASDMGSIEVQATGGDMVQVKVIREPETWSKKEAEEMLKNFQVDFSHQGKDVRVEARVKNRREDRHGGWRVQFIIKTPRKYNVNLNTAGGSITVGDLEGEVVAETAGGSLNFGNIKGPVRGRTAGGSISLDGCTGAADIKTSGGSINIGEVDGDVNARTSGGSISIRQAKGSVLAETSGGSIDVDEVMGNIEASTSGGSVEATISKQPKGDCRLETSAGSVTVYLAGEVAVDLDARSSWGKVECDFPVSERSGSEESALMGKINGGGPKLALRTSSGKVRIRKM
ncbi:MAG: DUF4097 family beta strand repeat protein [Calditrichaceae bacterium]|nr:DUF4097 domain-containing protein [Calditrichia bacterium]NUQ40025.1 DUF4097 family beta strand repeat protein [Calditrichaceae bacterium]